VAPSVAQPWLEGGWNIEQSIALARVARDRGVDLVDCSSGGAVLAKIPFGPGYQVPFLFVIRRGERQAQILSQTPFGESAAMFSPDGRWLAYVSTESGRSQIYVQAYPGPAAKWQISTDGGTEPMWNRNGRELFYRNGSRMMTVDIAAQPTFSASRPRVLFEGQYEPTLLATANYDVSPDGQRFLMLKASAGPEEAPTQINVVFNWFEELRRRVPTN
jgi:dipeptidyl aminopeptidase/acylaminoacyl peptidase